MVSVTSLTLALLIGLCSAQFCPTLHADFLRRQAAVPFNSPTPYNETHGAKHVPYISINGTKGTVTVGDGSPYHPMVASNDPTQVHFVTHIYVVDQDGGFVAADTLNPAASSIAQMEFDIPSGATKLQAYEWCNKHGLWKGPEVDVSAGPKPGVCSKAAVGSTAQASFIADFRRREAASYVWPFNTFDTATPFNETRGAKHVPYLTLNESIGTVTVGDGNPYHPMVGGNDPATVHFVTHIYVLDQDGVVITMQNLDPNGVSKATITFPVPDSATSLTAYEFCNKHGLWQGPTVQKPAGAVGNTSTTTSAEGHPPGQLSGSATVGLAGAVAFVVAMVGGIVL